MTDFQLSLHMASTNHECLVSTLNKRAQNCVSCLIAFRGLLDILLTHFIFYSPE